MSSERAPSDLQLANELFNLYCATVFDTSYVKAMWSSVDSSSLLKDAPLKESWLFDTWRRALLNKNPVEGLSIVQTLQDAKVVPSQLGQRQGVEMQRISIRFPWFTPPHHDPKVEAPKPHSAFLVRVRRQPKDKLHLFGSATMKPRPKKETKPKDLIQILSQPVLDLLQWCADALKEGRELAAKGLARFKSKLGTSPTTPKPVARVDPSSVLASPKILLPSSRTPESPEDHRKLEALTAMQAWLGPLAAEPQSLQIFLAFLADLLVLHEWLAYSYAQERGERLYQPLEPTILHHKDNQRLVGGLWDAYKTLHSYLYPLTQARDRAAKGPVPETHCEEDAFRKSHFYWVLHNNDLLSKRSGDSSSLGLWCDVFQDTIGMYKNLLFNWPALRARETLDGSQLRFFFGREVDRIGYGQKLVRDESLTRALLEALYEDAFGGKTDRPTPVHHNPLDGFVEACKGQASDLIRTYLGKGALDKLQPVREPSSPDTRLWSDTFVTLWQAMAVHSKGGEMVPPALVGAWWRETHGVRGGLDATNALMEEVAKEVEDFGGFLRDTAWIWEVATWWQVLGETSYLKTINALGLLYVAATAVDPTLNPSHQGLLACLAPSDLETLLASHAKLDAVTTTLNNMAAWTRRVAMPLLKHAEKGVPGRRYALDPALKAITLHYSVLESPLPPSLTSSEWTDAKASIFSMVIGAGTCGVQGRDLWVLLGHSVGKQWFEDVGGDVEAIGASILTCYLLPPPAVQELFAATPEVRGHYGGALDHHCIPAVQVLFGGALSAILASGGHHVHLDQIKTMTKTLFASIDHGIGGHDRVVPTQGIFRALAHITPDNLAKALASNPTSFRQFIVEVAQAPVVKDDTCWDGAKGPKVHARFNIPW